MNITANAASLNWRTNNHGVWKALVKDMAPNSSVTFSDGLTGTVAGRQVTVESPSMPTGFMTYTTDDDTAVFGGVLYGAGTASDSLEAVVGEKTVRMGSVDLGTLTWTHDAYHRFYANVANKTTKAASVSNLVCEKFTVGTNAGSLQDKEIAGVSGTTQIYIKDLALDSLSAAEFKSAMSGVILYYELAEPTTSTETAQPMSLAQGSDTIGGGSFSATYEGTEYELPIGRNTKYILRNEAGAETLITGTASVVSVAVTGGVSKLINLTHWFGNGLEPSIADFYKLYPTWKNYDIPYIPGAFVNYKGTGVQTIGFNAYNHATGTAELLGGNKYQICGTYTSVSYVDQWGESEELELDEEGIFTPTNNGTLTVVGGNATDTCVHLCWSGYKNFGEREYQWEPFVRNVHNINVSQYFPEGMNGGNGYYDELHTDSKVQRIFVHVFDGTEGFNMYQNYHSISWAYTLSLCPLMVRANRGFGASNKYPANEPGNYSNKDNPCIIFGQGNTSIYFMHVLDNLGFTTVAEYKNWLAQQYAAGTPLIVMYPMATPVVTQLPSPINLTYPVNDFGTEQSLPVNTTDLVTTDLHALIRYNTDYMRMNTQLSEIFPTVRSLAQQEQAGEIMKTDATAPNATVGNAYNLIDRNAAGTERQFSFDTSGGTQDIADGTAIAKKVMGTTLNLNQLVHDTNENTVESVDGNATVSDAVEGQVKHLVVSGDTVVVNQLVHEYVEKTESGTGRIWIKDAFEKEAKGLKVTAPRSVVMNQLVQNGDFSDGTNGWNTGLGISVENNSATLTYSGTNGSLNTSAYSSSIFYNKKTLITCEIKAPSDAGDIQPFYSEIATSLASIKISSVSDWADKWTRYSAVFTRTSSTALSRAFLFCRGTYTGTVQIRNIQIVDLTQYFNGNTTLIDSIQTWDDLVAYDSAFASYVTYNTGAVKGVTPALTLNGAAQPFATAPQEMFGITYRISGGVTVYAMDSYDVVNGAFTRNVGSYTFTGNETFFNYSSHIELFYWMCDGKKNGLSNLYIAEFYLATAAANITTDDGVAGQASGTAIFFGRKGFTDPTAFAAYMAGKTIYFELATPTVTDVAPVAFDLVSHDNTIFQTSGDLQAGIEATYDGLNQTIALDPAHTYAFNHQYVEDSIITGESSIDCVGTEDNLVDLTQLYAGDATRIAAIHSWASLSSRIHMYRDWLPYNPGEIVNLSATIRVYQHEHAYGVVYDQSQSSPVCQRVELNDGVITEVEEFTSLPAHNFRRCVMDDLATRHVNYYLDPLDSTKKTDGTPSVLTGADGDVMVEIPITHWYIDEDYEGTGKVLWLVSDQPFTGSEIHPYFYVGPGGDTARTQYVGAYRASVCDADGLPLNTTEGAFTQASGTAATCKARSIAGALPWVSVTLENMRAASVRNGGRLVNRLFHEYLMLMMVVEGGTLDTQAAFSLGYSNGLRADRFYNWRKSGRTNYGNGTGEIFADPDSQDMDNFLSITAAGQPYDRAYLYDTDGYYAWSTNHNPANQVLRYTATAVPVKDDIIYTDTAGTEAATITAVTNKADDQRVIQFQYRGIENPFGEVNEFEDGMQKYQKVVPTTVQINNVLHYQDRIKNGAGTKTAWTSENGATTYWTLNADPGNNAVAYSDAACTVDSGYKTAQAAYTRVECELWTTMDTDVCTSIVQHATSSKAYCMKRNYLPNGGYIKIFDPRTFLPRVTGNGAAVGKYLPDYTYSDYATGTRLPLVGGTPNGILYNGLGSLQVYYTAQTYATVNASGRPSA